MEEKAYAYWLHTREGIGNRTIIKLLDNGITPRQLWSLSECEIEKLSELTKKQKQTLIVKANSEEIAQAYHKVKDRNINFITMDDKEYPDKLLQIPDPPYALYLMGDLPQANKLTVAVIGARECSGYGEYIAKALGTRLAECDIQVISGLARGVDSIAQRAALVAGGEVYAVLGSGVDVCYPRENKETYEEIKQEGGVLSEYPPGTEPLARNFPPRNRIISGLADIVVVVEAMEKSGTFITVDMALEQGKEVYALPGRVTDPLSVGCNRLIRQGAEVLLDIEEFIVEVVREKTKIGLHKAEKSEQKKEKARLTENEERILEKIDFYPKDIQIIYDNLNEDAVFSMQNLIKGINNLEKQGVLVRKGMYFYKTM